ncbi:MAG TPA: hypothetical protein VEL07_19410 [Planctomycetota bacterium]|nr:hypothetical protein [Planctomycetota bacterium]
MRPFCQVVELLPGEHVVIAASPYASVAGVHLYTGKSQYDAEQYARRVNALARVFRRGRAAAATA